MRHWLLLATRNWQARPGRAAGMTMAIALGVGTVVWVTCSYESVRRSISDQVIERWVGRSHLSIESPLGHWGQIDCKVADIAWDLAGVHKVTARLRRRMTLGIIPEEGQSDRVLSVDAIGIEPASEYVFRSYQIDGRTILPEDDHVAIIEAKTAKQMGIRIGDQVRLQEYPGAPGASLEIVGLYHAQRVAKFQKPTVILALADLQSITGAAGLITIVDVMLEDPTPVKLEQAAATLRSAIGKDAPEYQVVNSAARVNQLQEAQRQTEFALTMVASVALLTAFFIISTTMSMGVVERIRQMGTLRCIGMTRGQLGCLALAEVAPIGVVGLLGGIPIGLGLTYAGTLIAPDYMQEIAISVRGITVALIGGAVTTLGGGLLPALQVSRVSPLEATRPQARPAGRTLPLVAAIIGALMVGGHCWMVVGVDPVRWVSPSVAITGVGLLYIGYALMMPFAVQIVGGLAVQLVARMLRLRTVLLNDQIGRAAWRGGGICCGLMVGLSLLISVVVHAEGVRIGWDFPKRLAEAFVWTQQRVPSSYVETVRGIPGVEQCTVVNDFLVDVGQSKSRFFKLFKIKSTFVAGETDVFLNMTKLQFLEGEVEDARAKLRRGGYILVPPEASRGFGLHLGDKVPITAAGRTAVFEVAGVVQSPALDIAVTYFQADTYMMEAAANSVLGTLEDAKKHFGADSVSMFLMNFSLPVTAPPDLFAQRVPPVVTNELVAGGLIDWGDRLTNDLDEMEALGPRLARWAADSSRPFNDPWLLDPYRRSLEYVAERWADRLPKQRWEMFCDRLIMHRVISAINRPNAIFGSLRELKQQIDDDIREATLLLAAIPVVALLVAAIGVGNLMAANVLSRTREIGILRSTGATRWQIMRLVLGEAMVLGGIGSAAGLALGIHAAHTANELTVRAIGFAPSFVLPWGDIGLGIALTVGVCILAGLSPAHLASRRNIIDAIRAP